MEAFREVALVADEQQTPIFLGPVVLPLLIAHLRPVLDAAADDPVRVDARLLRDVGTRVHLAHVRRERASVLRGRVEIEAVVALRVLGQIGIVPHRCDGQRRPRLPASREPGAQELGAVNRGVVDLEGVLGEEPAKWWVSGLIQF